MWEVVLYYLEESILYYMPVFLVGSALVFVAYCCYRGTGDEAAPPMRLTLDQNYRLMLDEANSNKEETDKSLTDDVAHELVETELSPSSSVSEFRSLSPEYPSVPSWEDQTDLGERVPIITVHCEQGPEVDIGAKVPVITNHCRPGPEVDLGVRVPMIRSQSMDTLRSGMDTVMMFPPQPMKKSITFSAEA